MQRTLIFMLMWPLYWLFGPYSEGGVSRQHWEMNERRKGWRLVVLRKGRSRRSTRYRVWIAQKWTCSDVAVITASGITLFWLFVIVMSDFTSPSRTSKAQMSQSEKGIVMSPTIALGSKHTIHSDWLPLWFSWLFKNTTESHSIQVQNLYNFLGEPGTLSHHYDWRLSLRRFRWPYEMINFLWCWHVKSWNIYVRRIFSNWPFWPSGTQICAWVWLLVVNCRSYVWAVSYVRSCAVMTDLQRIPPMPHKEFGLSLGQDHLSHLLCLFQTCS